MSQSLEAILDRVRPSVRREKAYHVGELERIEVKLNQNENPFRLPAELQSEFADILSDFAANRYPSIFPEQLVSRLADNLDVDPRSIVVGHGSNELAHFLSLCFIESGTRVVLPRPMFSLYETVVRLFGGALVEVPCRDDFSFDTDELLKRIRLHEPGLTIIANPNNPTGLLIESSVIEQIVQQSDGIVVIDEAYIEFAPDESVLRMVEEYPNLIVLRTLSKAFGLAGIRVGYMVGHPDLIHEMKKARLPFMIGHHDERCAIALLNRPELVGDWIEDMIEQTAWLSDQLTQMDGVRPMPTRTNFFLFSTDTPLSEVADFLGSSHIAIRQMSGYPELQAYLRVCAGTPDENQRFVDALKSAIR